ncbi:MAG: hypothetical protein ACI4W6_04205, partial [Acutalibacteraceae bacterium]
MSEYIVHESLMNKLNAYKPDKSTVCDYGDCVQEGFEHAVEIIENQPAADVAEVRHGKWILENDLGNGMADYKCSVCDYDDTFCIALIQRNFYKYCTCCGAKMD